MRTDLLDNLISSLGDLSRPEGAPFSYHRDEYALLLLGWALQRRPRRVFELRRGPFGQLLKKPLTRQALARASRGWLDPEDLAVDEVVAHRYMVTLGRWGDPDDHLGSQMTRRGENLVVHVNFPDSHDEAYRRLIDPKLERPFEWSIHPHAENRLTLAWARIDIDLEAGEALIEEIQSDWVREAKDAYDTAKSTSDETVDCDDLEVARDKVIEYVEQIMAPHVRIWSELTLSAALWVLVERLGIERVWFHTHEGSRLKGDCEPPKSLYSRLPRKFCFERTRDAPSFLRLEDSPVLAAGLGEDAKEPVDFYRLEVN